MTFQPVHSATGGVWRFTAKRAEDDAALLDLPAFAVIVQCAGRASLARVAVLIQQATGGGRAGHYEVHDSAARERICADLERAGLMLMPGLIDTDLTSRRRSAKRWRSTNRRDLSAHLGVAGGAPSMNTRPTW